jgi:hypothetical protein
VRLSRPNVVARRAEDFARARFPPCAVHREEAAAVFAILEVLNRGPLHAQDPDVPLAELLPSVTRGVDSLDAIERKMAIEAELGSSELASLALAELADESVAKPLLGPAWSQSSWDPATIWSRSLRGVVNERVRYRGGCTCG